MNPNNFKPPNYQTYPSNQPRQPLPNNQPSQSNTSPFNDQQYTINHPYQIQNNSQIFPPNTQTNYRPNTSNTNPAPYSYEPKPLNTIPTHYNYQPQPSSTIPIHYNYQPQPSNTNPTYYNYQSKPLNTIPAPYNYQPQPSSTIPIYYNSEPKPLNTISAPYNYQPQPSNTNPTHYNYQSSSSNLILTQDQSVLFNSFIESYLFYPTTQEQQQIINSTKKDLKVNLGPIIGYVTHDSARILVEFNKTEQVTCFLESSHQKIIACQRFSQANKPVVFKFKNLLPKTQYRVTLNCPFTVQSSSFRTLREEHDEPGNLKVAIVSCNDISRQYQKTTDKDLWRHLGNQVRNQKLDYVFHIGDQVYMDMAFNDKTDYLYGDCRKILENTSTEQWNSQREGILKILRQPYYKTWGHLSVADLLANVPNLTIGDDHEFRDDWGWREDDYTPGTIDHFIGECTRQLYYEYQRQLREDIPWENLAELPRHEYHHHILNGVGVSFMEYRGCRSWYREANLEGTHIGQEQTDWLETLYGQGGIFEEVNSAIFLSPLPLFVFSKFVSKMARVKGDDIQEYWTYKSFPQLIKLLDLIRRWKQRKYGRDLVIVGGDIHLGGTTDIKYGEDKIFTQFVCSAINSHESSWIAKGLLNWAMNGELEECNYTFKHNDWTRKNNYGVVEVFGNSQSSIIECKLEEL